ncbi:alpha-N-acetylgalactosamine-specific lectin-like [Diadema setosum]|uniref:alpha-N-acetylgalactosamine-specific lectin-like n=1 Tax=Diadema setosum TaxID=31175 RepID=UPI003B3A29FF
MKFVVAILLAGVTTATLACPPYWSPFRGSCYRYFGDRKLQANAESHCRTFFTTGGQGSLVSIADDVENSFVYDLFRSVAGDTDDWSVDQTMYGYWIGLYQEVTDGPWLWTDGTPVGYYNWKIREPNDSGNAEDCVHIWRREDGDDALKHWNDLRCNLATRKLAYVCEMPNDYTPC